MLQDSPGHTIGICRRSVKNGVKPRIIKKYFSVSPEKGLVLEMFASLLGSLGVHTSGVCVCVCVWGDLKRVGGSAEERKEYDWIRLD